MLSGIGVMKNTACRIPEWKKVGGFARGKEVSEKVTTTIQVRELEVHTGGSSGS